MLLYIKPSAEGYQLTSVKTTTHHHGSFTALMNTLLKPELTTYQGRMKALAKWGPCQRNIPIYVNHALCLMTTHAKNNPTTVFINVQAVICIKPHKHGQSTIHFLDLTTLNVPIAIDAMTRKYKRALHFFHAMRKTMP